MTDKERLEEIENCIKYDLSHNDGMMLSVCYTEIRWLIEQAERVQELEKEKERFIHFTGLKDKHGKEIDNGAVIKRYKDSIVLGKKTKVEFYQKIVYVEKYAQYLLEDKNGVQEHASWASTGEVVGNIHEDKDWMAWEKKGV